MEKQYRIRRADAVLVAAVLAAALLVTLLFPGGDAGRRAEVFVAGEKIADLPLSRPTTLDIPGVCQVVVADGAVFVRDAFCPDRICEKTGAISRQGQAIFCLPGRLCVRIPSEEVDDVVS